MMPPIIRYSIRETGEDGGVRRRISAPAALYMKTPCDEDLLVVALILCSTWKECAPYLGRRRVRINTIT
jgi:hypothetical protein